MVFQYPTQDKVISTSHHLRKSALGNESGADYFISFHRNASPNANEYQGVETLVFDDQGIKAEMARNVNANLEQVGFRNIGVKERPNLTVLRRTKIPAILIEEKQEFKSGQRKI